MPPRNAVGDTAYRETGGHTESGRIPGLFQIHRKSSGKRLPLERDWGGGVVWGEQQYCDYGHRFYGQTASQSNPSSAASYLSNLSRVT